MDFSKVKLVVSDMDGTLLNSQHVLSPEFLSVFKKLRNKGIQFVAASGRQYFNLLNLFPEIKDDMYFIADNGSYLAYRGQDLLVQAMQEDMVKEQLEIARTIPDCYPILCGKRKAYIEDDVQEFITHVDRYYSEKEVVEDLLEVMGDDFLKIALCDFKGAPVNSYSYFKHLEHDLQIKISGEQWLDLSHKLANKGQTLQNLQHLLGITSDETMVFGDYLNDLEMMECAHFSYAMANAHSAIKEAARFGTRSNDEDGVMDVLRQVVSS